MKETVITPTDSTTVVQGGQIWGTIYFTAHFVPVNAPLG